MGEFVLAVGVLLIGITLYLLVRPQALIALIDQVLTTRWLFLVALVRLLLGAALIASASAVGFSGVIAAIGWLGALSGMVLVAVPPPVWERFSEWLKRLPIALLRIWTLMGLSLGGFLIFASLS